MQWITIEQSLVLGENTLHCSVSCDSTAFLLFFICIIFQKFSHIDRELIRESYSLAISVVRYPRYLDTYRRYLRDDTNITKVTIYRGIS